MCCEGLDIMLINSDGAMAKRGIPGRTDLTRPLTGRSVVVILGLFFGVMFIANGALIYTALSTLHGEEMENSYDASQAYNRQIAAARAQNELGWVADVDTRQEGGGARVVAEFRDRNGSPVAGLEVRVSSIPSIVPPTARRRSFPTAKPTKASPARCTPAAGPW